MVDLMNDDAALDAAMLAEPLGVTALVQGGRVRMALLDWSLVQASNALAMASELTSDKAYALQLRLRSNSLMADMHASAEREGAARAQADAERDMAADDAAGVA